MLFFHVDFFCIRTTEFGLAEFALEVGVVSVLRNTRPFFVSFQIIMPMREEEGFPTVFASAFSLGYWARLQRWIIGKGDIGVVHATGESVNEGKRT